MFVSFFSSSSFFPHEIQEDHAIEDDLDSMIFNPIASATFKMEVHISEMIQTQHHLPLYQGLRLAINCCFAVEAILVQ
jgi:hypothetical protein